MRRFFLQLFSVLVILLHLFCASQSKLQLSNNNVEQSVTIDKIEDPVDTFSCISVDPSRSIENMRAQFSSKEIELSDVLDRFKAAGPLPNTIYLDFIVDCTGIAQCHRAPGKPPVWGTVFNGPLDSLFSTLQFSVTSYCDSVAVLTAKLLRNENEIKLVIDDTVKYLSNKENNARKVFFPGAIAYDNRKRESVIGIINNHQNEIKRMYQTYLLKQGLFCGKIVIKFEINEQGIVGNSQVVQNTTKQEFFAEEISQYIKSIQFQRIDKVRDIYTCFYPFNFYIIGMKE